jgi:hypothetical protein
MAKVKIVAGEEVAKEEATLVGGTLDLNTEIAKQTDAVKAAITAGDVVARINNVKRNVESKPYRKEYLQLVPTNYKGMAAIAGGVETTWKSEKDKDGNDISDFDGPCAVKDFFYGNDLGAKSKESQRLAVLVEGPDKAKLAAAKQLAKAFNISEAEALKKIEAMA